MNQTEQNDSKGYRYIRNQIVTTGITPSLRNICKVVGYASPRSADLMLKRLAKRGLVKRVNGTIKLTTQGDFSSEQTVDVPLVGSVTCGSPSLAEQDPEAIIEISTRIARPGSTYFLLRAVGDSMNKAGINDGDLVLVRQQSTADNGERVVALINSDATVKRFYREGEVAVLKPDSTNKNHKTIVLSEEFDDSRCGHRGAPAES